MSKLLGAVEAGGTKFVCAVGQGPESLLEEIRFPTTSPEETLDKTIRFFKTQIEKRGPLAALGVGCFGPVDIHPSSRTFGRISKTPKTAWEGADVYVPLREALGIPVGFDTDVNAAALGEWRYGAAQGLDTFVYLTFGTGIGGGGMTDGRLMHGLVHPEMGHMMIPHDKAQDPYPGKCPFHRDCFEGLAAGPAIEARWGARGETLPEDHPAWELETDYIALGLMNLICILSPQRIILGGGMMQQAHLFPLIRQKVTGLLAGYVQANDILEEIDTYIVPPALGNRAGILGGIALADHALNASR
jgi:fructokinase